MWKFTQLLQHKATNEQAEGFDPKAFVSFLVWAQLMEALEAKYSVWSLIVLWHESVVNLHTVVRPRWVDGL